MRSVAGSRDFKYAIRSSISSTDKTNIGIWRTPVLPTTMPSARASAKPSTSYFLGKVRNGGASGYGLTRLAPRRGRWNSFPAHRIRHALCFLPLPPAQQWLRITKLHRAAAERSFGGLSSGRMGQENRQDHPLLPPKICDVFHAMIFSSELGLRILPSYVGRKLIQIRQRAGAGPGATICQKCSPRRNGPCLVDAETR